MSPAHQCHLALEDVVAQVRWREPALLTAHVAVHVQNRRGPIQLPLRQHLIAQQPHVPAYRQGFVLVSWGSGMVSGQEKGLESQSALEFVSFFC